MTLPPTKFLPVSRPDGRLEAGEVVVWRVEVASDTEDMGIAEALLSRDERDRAIRYFRDEHRRNFIVQRAHLRAHLGIYLSKNPKEIAFVYNDRGKPSVVGDGLEFNVSGSGDYGLLAFSRGAELGVDIERHREIEALELAQNFFSSAEIAELKSLPKNSQVDGFFAAWSRKEAFIKAVGKGLYYPLDRFSVSVSPTGEARLLRVEDSEEQAKEWTLVALPAPAGYSAALVRRGGPFALRLCEALPLRRWVG